MAERRKRSQPPAVSVHAILPPDPLSPGWARRLIAHYCPELGLDEAESCYYARLLVSELVTSAVLHSSSEVKLTITRAGDELLVTVGGRDTYRFRPHTTHADPLAGRGLTVVDELAAAWGVDAAAAGKSVWFRLPISAATAA